MNWIKQNTKLAAILGVMIVGGLGLGALLYFSWADYSAQMEQWTDLDQKATKLENSKFTPNAQNVAKLAEQLDEYREKFSLLQSVLLSEKLQQKKQPITETEFQAKLKERTRAVSQKAGKLTELPKDFALSFEEYTGTLPPSAEVAAELNIQLDVTEKFVNTLLEAGVKSIDSLTRTRLSTERAGPGPKPVPAPAAAGKKGQPVAAPLAEPVVEPHPITCVFTCDQGPLQSVMNNLSNPASTPQFLVVRQLHVENEKQEAPTKEEVKTKIKPQGFTPPAPSPDKLPGAKRSVPTVTPLPADAAEIMGGEMIKVYMEIDYLRFRQPPEGTAAPAPKR